jgi:hypothetical protein
MSFLNRLKLWQQYLLLGVGWVLVLVIFGWGHLREMWPFAGLTVIYFALVWVIARITEENDAQSKR